MVYGHALRGFWGAKEWPRWTLTQDGLIYSFHMPLFFVIGGLFLWQSIARDRMQFLRSRWWAMIYPYLLWSLICGGAEIAASKFANTPLSLRDLLFIPVTPIEQFWFLYALLIAQLIAAACFPSKSFLFLASAGGLVFATLSAGSAIVYLALRFLPFLALGVCAAPLIIRLSSCGWALQASTLAVSWLIFAITYSAEHAEPVRSVMLGSAGALGCLTAAMLICRSGGNWLELLGRASMAIYVLHTLFSAGVRASFVMLQLDRYALWTIVPEFLAGLVLPLPIWLWSRSRSKGYLLGFGVGPARTPGQSTRSLPSRGLS